MGRADKSQILTLHKYSVAVQEEERLTINPQWNIDEVVPHVFAIPVHLLTHCSKHTLNSHDSG